VQAPPADADRVRMQAAAAASYDRVALDRMLIEPLPKATPIPSCAAPGTVTRLTCGRKSP
jgi:flotillin